MSKKVIIFSVLTGICGFCPPEVVNGETGPRGRKFASGFGGVYREGELLVRFAPKDDGRQRSAPEKRQVLDSLGGGVEAHRYKLVPGLSLVKLPPGQTVEDTLTAFNNRPEILYAEANYEVRLLTEPNDRCGG